MDENALFALHQHAASVSVSGVTPVSYDPGHIVLSFFTSLIGCITTLELLQRRTSTRGTYNWFLLVAAAVAMGGIGIWAMHFVGNRAIVLDYGNRQRQILYNSGFTALSFFVPIVVLLVAFYMLEVPVKARQLHIALAAVLTGAAVCGMHYLGQMGIENYDCSYRIANVIGAAVIAILASYVALSVFFRLRDTWTDSWWKRAICGAMLATAVSGMHWTAAVGTVYHWKGDVNVHGSSRTHTAIIASALSMGACLVLLIVAFIRGRNKRSARIKAQRLVLACAYFDDAGRIMVTQEGILPSEKITNRYVEKTFGEDELSRSHATFLWVFQASHNWTALKDVIPAMKEHIDTDPATRRYRPSHASAGVHDDSSDLCANFAPLFKELFCVAAQQLANLIHEPLERIGVLFEEPLDTGEIQFAAHAPATDTEPGHVQVTRGKFFFLNRHLNSTEAARFATLGFRFATVSQVGESLAKSMQISRAALIHRIERMQATASPDHMPPPGVYLGCFMLRPSVHKSFDVLVPASRQDQLPCITIQRDPLSQEQVDQLKTFDNERVGDILKVLANQSQPRQVQEQLRWKLYHAFVKLIDLVDESDAMMQAKFCSRTFDIPCRPRHDAASTAPSTCTLLAVRLLRNIHSSCSKREMAYVPLTFFSAQQQILAAGPGDPAFGKTVQDEFGHLVDHAFAYGKQSSSVDFGRPGSESPRSATFRSSIARFSFSRRGDEGTSGEREKSVTETSEVEMTAVDLEHPRCASRSGVADSPAVENDKGHWVSDLFGLFRDGNDAWGTTKSAGWKWDINVVNSLDIGTKDRRAAK